MPDGYGDNTDLSIINALNLAYPHKDAAEGLKKFIAQHLHHDHGLGKYEVRQRMGVSMKELRELLDE